MLGLGAFAPWKENVDWIHFVSCSVLLMLMGWAGIKLIGVYSVVCARDDGGEGTQGWFDHYHCAYLSKLKLTEGRGGSLVVMEDM